ncbi:SLATT domain-containing protein [Burkholderia multivorans]|uniref:SLATT domain-containing protein n=2 Tax=Burkholderia multivorans TaxID=87883 RepID=UPI0015E28CF5|nr:SLATT domain-containing protein [Burkholderia multivorans]MBU9290144.1 SLATT domain-containing protein [Burkholderia multivorans]MBU9612865.1 SLATT domain-containing protein [Burkholderia multivorans]
MKDAVKQLSTTIWITAGARYNAARRLRLRDTFSTASLSMFSAATIGLAVIQKVYFISNSPADKYSTVLGVTLGAFLLAVSLLEAGKGNALSADALHRNAEDLTSLAKKIDVRVAAHDVGQSITAAELADLNREYDEIRARCATNHLPVDYRHFLGEKRAAAELAQRFGGKPPATTFQATRYHIQWFLSGVWYFLLLWIAVIALCLENWLLYRG